MERLTLVLWMCVLFVAVPSDVGENSGVHQPFGVKMCIKWGASLGNYNSVTFITKTLSCNLGNVTTTPMSAGQRLRVTNRNTTGKCNRRILSKLKGYVILKKKIVKKKDYKLFSLDEASMMCVKYHHEEKTWQDALTVCQSEGGSLVKLHIADRMYLFHSKIHSLELSRQQNLPWIGVKYWTEDEAWHWTDGTLISDYGVYWGDREPIYNACAVGGHYGQYMGRWKSDQCTVQHSFICEVPAEFCYV